jgi:hypothetical protein
MSAEQDKLHDHSPDSQVIRYGDMPLDVQAAIDRMISPEWIAERAQGVEDRIASKIELRRRSMEKGRTQIVGAAA